MGGRGGWATVTGMEILVVGKAFWRQVVAKGAPSLEASLLSIAVTLLSAL